MHKLYSENLYKGKNSMTAQMLGVLAFFIEHGAFQANSDYVSLIIQALIKILDSSSDEYKPGNLCV